MGHKIVIAGAGGIASAVALIIAEWGEDSPQLFIGNRTLDKAQGVAQWIKDGVTKSCEVKAFLLSENDTTSEMASVFSQADILLDCLPGSLAPRMAGYAKEYGLHYVNLTEYVAETKEIMALAKDAETGFVLQSGLAPGYIDLLAHHLFLEFCKENGVDKVGSLEFKVGALTHHAVAPHYYGFTWSPVGVATEYIKDAETLRNYKIKQRPSLSERATIIIDGIAYEEDLTSGGAADLPHALEGKVGSLDYKTLRHPGHYAWVDQQIKGMEKDDDTIGALQRIMGAVIPHMEDDQIVLYAAVEGKDAKGTLRRKEIANKIYPQKIGKHTLKAIQTTTAVPMIQAAYHLLTSNSKGLILQSQLDPLPFLNGKFVTPVYGEIKK
ncbi:Shikimate dehydrogenase (NADP(+)) [Arenibacter antarcticus]|uniref:Saccharopine dehydrogenase family protein n=1 Tax=Arenibacter antarcticus TaxID=2040469 RepID=A0ABW5VKA5_9FLAO|nr:saccharopine dehydrogenase C-terminal domain-containing protein [Arenibacter sp. H213]MCM4167240.1 saccharopine dehydrogenase [Arenibacter sp. H213]